MQYHEFFQLNIISISPFSYSKVDSGVKWRVNFMLDLMRSSNAYVTSEFKGSLGSNTSFTRYISLFNPFWIIKILFYSSPQDVFLCHTFFSSFYVIFLKLFRKKVFIDHHNIEFDRFRSYSNKYFSQIIRRLEFLIVRLVDLNIFCSEEDANRAVYLYTAKNILVVPNCFDSKSNPFFHGRDTVLSSLGLSPKCVYLLFFGSLDYYPNIEAVNFIVDEILPKLEQFDQVIILIAGRGLTIQFDSKQLICLGFVDDLDALIKSVNIVIAPIFSGGGVKIKVVHALALGQTVLTTQEGARGIDRHPHMIVGNRNNFSDLIITHLGI